MFSKLSHRDRFWRSMRGLFFVGLGERRWKNMVGSLNSFLIRKIVGVFEWMILANLFGRVELFELIILVIGEEEESMAVENGW